MAERNGALLRARLRSAERFSEAATERALRAENTRDSRLSAWLSRVTRPDQRRVDEAMPWCEQRVCLLRTGPRGLAILERRADCGDQLVGVDRLVDPVGEAGGTQPLTLDLRERGERDGRNRVVDARSEERRVGKSGEVGGGRVMEKNKA